MRSLLGSLLGVVEVGGLYSGVADDLGVIENFLGALLDLSLSKNSKKLTLLLTLEEEFLPLTHHDKQKITI